MPVSGNEKISRKKKLNHSNSFRNQHGEDFEPFRRGDELRHSTGSMKGHYGVNNRSKNEINMKYSARDDGVYHAENDMNGKRAMSNEFQFSDREDHTSQSRSVSHLIKGFESKSGSSLRADSNRFLSPGFGTYEDNSECETGDKHKRNGSKRKLSIRKRGKGSNDANITILQKLGITPFMGSENRNPKKALSHFDVQSVLFDIENAAVLKTQYADGGNRPKNISTGASAASIRAQRKNTQGSNTLEKTRTDSIVDDGDGTSNELVQNCPYFRNEIGSVETKEENPNNINKLFGKYTGDMSNRIWSSMSKTRTKSMELLSHSTDHENDVFSGTHDFNEIDQKKDITILEEIDDKSKIVLWDRPKRSTEKRIFDFEHVDMGAMYYKEYFLGKEHQNFHGIDEKYGPMCISMIRENIEKMAVLGHAHDHRKNGTNKYQYRIILRTTELQTFRGTALEESIPSATRHGTSKTLPARDILEYCFPEIQTSCLKTAIVGPKVPEHLQKLDEQQLSLQFKVGLLYCKAGQNSEEDMYNNEHHGPAFDEFMDVIGEKVLLKGFEGYKAQLDNKNDSTGTYSLHTKFHNREIMFHVSTLLPWTPNNKQQLLRKRHIGNDIVTVIFQEPGAEPFTPKNIRSHFQHVFIVVRVENPNTNDTTYKVAVSRSQDVPEFGPPIPPDSSFRNNKAFRDFLLSKIINAENAAHKSEKFTAMTIRTRYEYLKDLATNFVTTQTIDSGVAKFSKFNPRSLSAKRREKIHPPCSPEVWCQAALVWSVKVEIENAATAKFCFLAMSTKVVGLIDKVTKEIIAAIPCKAVIGWRTTGYSMRLYYNNGQGINIYLVEDDGNEMTFVINRLKSVTPGCETQDMSLRRSASGQLGFHVFYEGLVAEVEPYGMAWQAGLRKGSRLLEISNRLVGKMSHDRMIQTLKKPGSIRVVVLPPLPDGQPRNYKSTRNLKRYSSMTSVYSERIPNCSDSSISSSSKENIALDAIEFDTVIPIRVGGSEITTVEAKVKPYAAPYSINRQNNNHIARPHGFILDSDQSLEFTESSPEHVLSSSGNLTALKRQNGYARHNDNSLSSMQVRKDRMTATGRGSAHKKLDPKAGSQTLPKTAADSASASTSSSLGSFDPELSELEKTISDTRKSIDAKFYRSLVQSAMRKKLNDQTNRAINATSTQDSKNSALQAPEATKNVSNSSEGIQTQVSEPPLNSYTVRNVGSLEKRKPDLSAGSSSQETSSSFANVDDLPSASSQDESAQGSHASLSRLRSPPPYEEAVTLLENRRIRKSKVLAEKGNNVKKKLSGSSKEIYMPRKEISSTPTDFSSPPNEMSSPPPHSSDSSKEDKPKVLRRQTSKDQRRNRSMNVRSANFEDRFGKKGIYGEGLKNTDLMAARSESNIHFTLEKEGRISDNEDRLRSGNIVQTRVRDVNDVMNEKVYVRSGSTELLTGLSSSRSSRQSSMDGSQGKPGVSPFYYAMPKKLSRKSSREERDVGRPYSSHQGRLSKSQEDIAKLTEKESLKEFDRVPFKETTLGPKTTTVETFSDEKEVIDDTFAKIDQAFGFTSYVTSNSVTTPTVKEEKRRKKPKHRQRARLSKVFSDSSEDESTCSSLNSVGSQRRSLSGRQRIKSTERLKSVSQDPSSEKKKSEAEESLEAAITEFNSTLSNMPDQCSIQNPTVSQDAINRTPTPLDKGFSGSKTSDEETPKLRKVSVNLNTSARVKRDSTDNVRGPVQISRKTIVYPENKAKVYFRSVSRQSSGDSPYHSAKESGSRVLELVGKFSQGTRKGSLDLSTPKRGSFEKFRSRSEARISFNSPSPWVRKDSKQSVFKTAEAISSVRRLEKHRISHAENIQQKSAGQNETPVRKRISVTVRPKLEINPKEKELDSVGPLPVIPNSPSWLEACDRGMSSLPGRGKKNGNLSARGVVDMSLSVRGLDLAPQRSSEEVDASSKEDLRLMLSVLSGELVKEKSENEKLMEELEHARIEKEQLLEQSKASASQLRKFTSWFYDSMSNKDSQHFNGN